MIRDPIDQQLRIHLAEEERADRREALIADRAQELLEGEYHPLRPENFYEGLSEMSQENQAKMRAAFCHGDDKAIGATLRAAMTDYWQTLARSVAERIVERAHMEDIE